ncbi:MAG: hypothetical protein K2H87_00475 [Duncaniella sp.]|nr:hypothetical protein [Duncaniella sp.]
MTQITINVENPSILPHLKKILGAIEGISIAKTTRKPKTGLSEAMDDIKTGRLNSYESAEDMFEKLGI